MKTKDDDRLIGLRKQVSKASTSPGVYRWLNAKGDVLYVGKAKNLQNRLKSYVSPAKDATLGPWKESLIDKIADFDCTVTHNELEALILESNLIKELKPRYNVLLKDDKNYVYLRISAQEDFPYIDVVRRMEEDGAKYFGPFLTANSLRKLLVVLQDIYGYRACRRSLDQLNKDPKAKLTKACLEYQIGKCCGLCVGAISPQEYQQIIQHLISFFKGNRKDVLSYVQQKMQKAATEKKFEQAATLRDALRHIHMLDEQQIVSDTTGNNADYIGVVLQSEKAQVVLLQERGGKLVGERNFALGGQAETIASVLEQFLPQYYSTATDIPSSIFLGDTIEQPEVVEEWLGERKGKRVRIMTPERGKKSKLLLMAEKNAQEKIQQQLARWEAAAKNAEEALEVLKDILQLPTLPKRIEGYDISHLGGTETVGSMVVLRNGKTANDQYRSFTIRTLEKGKVDDYSALREVLHRRLLHLVHNVKEEEKVWNTKGITFAKARKTEQAELEQIIAEHPKDGLPSTIDYKEVIVARKENSIVGFARLFIHKGNVKEVQSLWVKEDFRDAKLGQFIVRKLLQKAKKDKVYITIPPERENYYAEIGFRYLISPPPVLAKKMQTAEKKSNTQELPMVYIPSDNKKDVSLTTRPDLLVIDGGKGQLSTVTTVLEELSLDIPVIGLAKREEDVFVPGRKTLVAFPKDSQAKFLLMRLRDEAHRFANRHRTARGKKSMTHSLLDDVPGIGEQTKKLLLQEFGSVEDLRQASDEQLRSVLSQQQLVALRAAF